MTISSLDQIAEGILWTFWNFFITRTAEIASALMEHFITVFVWYLSWREFWLVSEENVLIDF